MRYFRATVQSLSHFYWLRCHLLWLNSWVITTDMSDNAPSPAALTSGSNNIYSAAFREFDGVNMSTGNDHWTTWCRLISPKWHVYANLKQRPSPIVGFCTSFRHSFSRNSLTGWLPRKSWPALVLSSMTVDDWTWLWRRGVCEFRKAVHRKPRIPLVGAPIPLNGSRLRCDMFNFVVLPFVVGSDLQF